MNGQFYLFYIIIDFFLNKIYLIKKLVLTLDDSDFVPEDLEFEHDRDTQIATISGVGAYVTKEWKIDLHG